MYKIQYIHRLAFYNQISKEKRNNELCDQIIKKYKEGTIKTEKLKNDLFSFRLNDTKRVISTIILQDKKNTLLILELLPHHEYSKSKYLNNPINLDNFRQGHHCTIVNNLREASLGKTEIDSLPTLGFVRHRETTLLLHQHQLAVLEDEQKRSIITITGAAGSGKTLIAELLIKQKNDHKILYVTQSNNLVADVNEHCNEESNADIKTFESLCANILEGKALKVKAHFIQWAKKNTKKNHIIDSFKVKGKLDDNIARELYEDICKVHDSDGDSELGKKSLHYDEDTLKELYTLYLKQLNENKSIDLSLYDYTNHDQLDRYDIILVDESQDFGSFQLKYIKHFLKNNGFIYFFIDTNQSLSSDFNLIYRYISKLSERSDDITAYQLETSYRTPAKVTSLVNIITQLKRKILGGRLNPDILEIKSTQNDNPGNIYCLDLSMNNIENKNALEKLQKESEKSIQIAFIAPYESVIKNANTLFPNGIIYTPDTIKGLEFKKIVLVDFLNKNNSGLKATQLDADESDQDKINFPKNTEQAKYSRFFNQLFISATRTTHSLYFIQTTSDEITKKINEKFKFFIDHNPSEAISLSDSSPEKIIQFIMDKKNQLDLPKLVDYCKKACDNTQSPVNDDLLQSFKYLKEILSMRSTQTTDKEQQGNLTCLIERIDLILEKPQPLDLVSVDTHETIKISSNTPMTAPPHDKRLCLEDLKNIDLLTIHEKQLEQVINDSGRNVLLSLLCLREDLPGVFKNDHENISSFAQKVTTISLNQQDKNGVSALYWLVRQEKLKTIFNQMTKDINFIKKIDKNNFEKIISTGWSPLLLCLNNKNLSEYLKKYTSSKKFLKDSFSKTNCKFSDIPLNFFAKIGNNQVIKYLIDKGADINLSSPKGITALQYAATEGCLETVKVLVNKGANINILNSDGNTALHFSTLDGHIAVIKYLINKKADVNIHNSSGKTALQCADLERYPEIVEVLVNKKEDLQYSSGTNINPIVNYITTSSRQTDTTIMPQNDNIVSAPIDPIHRGGPLNSRGL